MTNPTLLPALLQELERELKFADLWQTQLPNVQKLQSTEPFALDTLFPHEWLQWIFLPRMQQLLATQSPLPQGFLLSPYFDEMWKEMPQHQAILKVLQQIDQAVASC